MRYIEDFSYWRKCPDLKMEKTPVTKDCLMCRMGQSKYHHQTPIPDPETPRKKCDVM
jgi:hypothetical protein